MNHECKVTVLMSTYNGEKYLKEQLDSIIKQRGIKLKLVIRDDGSTDNTINLLENYNKSFSELSFYKGSNIGYKKSFMELIYNIKPEHDFYAFSDQDDVWHEEKLLKAIEKIGKKDVPMLYFSNCLLVNNEMNFLGNLHDDNIFIPNTIESSITNGFAHGCTMVFNKSALKLIKRHKLSNEFAHDYWIPLIIKQFGEIVYDKESYIKYRQHENNVFGGQKISTYSLIKQKIRKSNEEYKFYSNVAKELLVGYSDLLKKTDKDMLNRIINYPSDFKSKLFLLKNKEIKRSTFRGTVFLKFKILMNSF